MTLDAKWRNILVAKNMDLFNKGAALILAKLYDEFPKPIHLNITHLDENMSDEEGEVYGATLMFLRDEGFIRCGESLHRGLMTSNVVLSSKGLDILNSTPDALKEKISLGEKIKEVAKNGTKEAISTVIQAVIGTVVANGI